MKAKAKGTMIEIWSPEFANVVRHNHALYHEGLPPQTKADELAMKLYRKAKRGATLEQLEAVIRKWCLERTGIEPLP
jgi:hypothetical protein